MAQMLQIFIYLAVFTVARSAVIEKSAETKHEEIKTFVTDLTRLAKERSRRNADQILSYIINNGEESGIIGDWVEARDKRSAAVGTRFEVHRRNEASAYRIPCGSCVKRPKRITIRKPTCHIARVVVPSCRGMCETYEIPLLNGLSKKHHTVCQPKKVSYRRIQLKGCARGQNPYHTVGVVKECACAKCSSSKMACRPLF